MNFCSDIFQKVYKPGACLLQQGGFSKEGLTEKSCCSLGLASAWLRERGGVVRTLAASLFARCPAADLANSDCTSVVVTPNCQMCVQCKWASPADCHCRCFLHSLEMSRMRSWQRTLVFWELKLGISSLQVSTLLLVLTDMDLSQ